MMNIRSDPVSRSMNVPSCANANMLNATCSKPPCKNAALMTRHHWPRPSTRSSRYGAGPLDGVTGGKTGE